jgi:hypothetical protein
MMDALQVVTILVGVIVTGEATALAIGMHLIKKSDSPWVSLKNDLLLALDVVVGLALILIAFDGGTLIQPIWFSIFITIGLLTHIFRIWEYLGGRQTPFCGNRSLFIFNNIKFIGLLVILVWGWIV